MNSENTCRAYKFIRPLTPCVPNPRQIQFPFSRETGEDPSSPA